MHTGPGKYWNLIIIIPGLGYTEFDQRSWKLLEYEPIFGGVVSMTKNADTLSKQAEADNDMALVMKSNAYRLSLKVKDEDLPRCQRKLQNFARICKSSERIDCKCGR